MRFVSIDGRPGAHFVTDSLCPRQHRESIRQQTSFQEDFPVDFRRSYRSAYPQAVSVVIALLCATQRVLPPTQTDRIYKRIRM
jgi:hypothetical protein